ncbi:hypothetical protein YC2023_080725 [Brassica napus]
MESLLKYNALKDFQTTSKKSSRRLQRSLPDDFQEVFWRGFLPYQVEFTKTNVEDFQGSLLNQLKTLLSMNIGNLINITN